MRILPVVLLLLAAFLLPGSPGAAAERPLERETPEISAGGEMAGRPAPSGPLEEIAIPSTGGVLETAGFLGTGPFIAYNFNDNATLNGGSLFIPPDPIGAAGPDRLIAVVNCGIESRDKTGVLQWRSSLKNFVSSLGSPATLGTTTFDPKIIYDHYADRFVVVTLERWDTASGSPSNESRILLAVSKTSSPASATSADWYYASINSKITIGATPTWADYPGFECDEEAIYVTANMFSYGAPTFQGNRIWIVNKGLAAGFYAGGAMTNTVHNPVVGALLTATWMPAQVFGAAGAGPGVGTWLVGYDGLTYGGPGAGEAVQVVRIDDPLGGVGGPFFTGEFVNVGDIENLGGVYGFPALPDAPQLGTATLIEVNNRRALDAVWRDNQLYFTATINPNANDPANQGQTTAHLFRIDTANIAGIGAPAGLLVYNGEANIGAEDLGAGTYTYYPAVQVNSQGLIKVGFSASNGAIYAGAYAAPLDPTLAPGATITVKAGEDYYIRTFGSGRNRWGDYSGLSLDPSDDRVFWVFNEYAITRGTPTGAEDGRWGTAWKSCAQTCVNLQCPPFTVVQKGQLFSLNFCIVNCGPFPEPAMQVQIFDVNGWCPPTTAVVPLPAGGSQCFTYTCTAPPVCAAPNQIIFRAVSAATGDQYQCITPIQVQNQDPVALCKPATLQGAINPLTGSCEALVTPADVDNGSYDPDGEPVTLQVLPMVPLPVGMHPVRLIATDPCGAADTCMAMVTVLPCPQSCATLACPPDTVVAKGTVAAVEFCAVNCGGNDTWTIDITDDLGWIPAFSRVVTVAPGQAVCDTIQVPVPPACAPVFTTLKYKVTPSFGPADSCTTRVGTRNRPPVALCQNISVTGTWGPGGCSANVPPVRVDAGSFDLDGEPLVLSLNPPGPYPGGSNAVELIVTDPCGDADTCQATIDVSCGPRQEVAPPSITFVTVAYGDTACGAVTVKNTGDQTMTVSSIAGCSSGDFFLDLTGVALSVAAGDSTSFAVCYSPTVSGPDSCEVVVTSDGGVDTVRVVVSQTTAAPEPTAAVRSFTLSPIVPTPFSASAEIRFALPAEAAVRIEVFDFRGRLVRTLARGDVRGAGEHRVRWDGADDRGAAVSAGIYFVKVAAGHDVRTMRAVRMQ